jgi:hypothetical protein
MYEDVFHREEEESQKRIDELERSLKFSLGENQLWKKWQPKTTVKRFLSMLISSHEGRSDLVEATCDWHCAILR